MHVYLAEVLSQSDRFVEIITFKVGLGKEWTQILPPPGSIITNNCLAALRAFPHSHQLPLAFWPLFKSIFMFLVCCRRWRRNVCNVGGEWVGAPPSVFSPSPNLSLVQRTDKEVSSIKPFHHKGRKITYIIILYFSFLLHIFNYNC
jgi:hypothetical protein